MRLSRASVLFGNGDIGREREREREVDWMKWWYEREKEERERKKEKNEIYRKESVESNK